MSNFSQDQGNQGIARPACRMREQANPQIDAEIAEKGHLWMETRKLNAMSWQTWKTRIAREWLWFIFTVAGSSLLWYLVSCFFTEFWETQKIILLRLLSPEGGCVIKGRFEVIACLDVLTLMFVYILRFTAWSKRQIKYGMK